MVMLLADMVRTWAIMGRYGVGIGADRRTANTGRFWWLLVWLVRSGCLLLVWLVLVAWYFGLCVAFGVWGVFLCGWGVALRLVWRLNGFVALVRGVRGALRWCPARRCADGWRVRVRSENGANGQRVERGARIGDGAGVYPPVLNAHADFGGVTSPFRIKNFS